MISRRLVVLFLAIAVVRPPSAKARQRGDNATFREHLDVVYGVQLFGASAYRSAVVPTRTDYVIAIRAAANPMSGFLTEASVRMNPTERFAIVPYGFISMLERNRFYGFGNDTPPLQPTLHYQLDQLLIESGITTEISLGGAGNVLAIGPFFKRWNTTGDLNPALALENPAAIDDEGVAGGPSPYGIGVFRQLGLKFEAHGGTKGLASDAPTGFRFELSGHVSPTALDVSELTASMRGEVRTFLKFPLPGEPVVLLRGRLERAFGLTPFQDAAYLGGRRTLKGFKKQQFAGDLALAWGWELRGTAARITVLNRPMTLGPLALMDVGRVYVAGSSPGSWHLGAGGGFWLRHEKSQRQVSVALARGDVGPRFYIRLGSPLRP